MQVADRFHLIHGAGEALKELRRGRPLVEMSPQAASPEPSPSIIGAPARPLTGRRRDVVAWDDAARVVFGDFGRMTTFERDAGWRIFTSSAHRQLLVEWEGQARRVQAQFRAIRGRYPGDRRFTALIRELMRRSSEFRAWWPDEVLDAPEGRKTLNHSQVGYLMFESLTFRVFDPPDLRIGVSAPLDVADTPAKLARLLAERSSVSRGL